MSAVWVVRTKDGHFCYAYPCIIEAMDAAEDYNHRVTKETLLTPAHAAVIRDAACDIEHRVNEQYHGPDDVHPAMLRKYQRDMEIVQQLRAIAPENLRVLEAET